MSRKKQHDRSKRTSTRFETYYELEVIPGLAEFAQAELEEQGGKQVHILPSTREDRVRFQYRDNPQALLQLRQAVAVHLVKPFDIPRPKALLGHQNLHTLLGLIDQVLALHPPRSFQTFHVSAAGSDSTVFTRIKTQIEARTDLMCTQETGDLALAVRRPQALPHLSDDEDPGWETALRLSPRPLSARDWRVCDMPGALNGSVASILMSLTDPSPQDRVVNLACGSGTLLIERLALGPVQGAVGCDIDAEALTCAQENLIASDDADAVTLVRCDGGRAPLPDRWATTACVDLPFGMLIGSHESNEKLYPRLLSEGARLVRSGGKMAAITQEVRLFEQAAMAQGDRWAIIRIIPLKLPANTRSGYIRPRLYLLHRL